MKKHILFISVLMFSLTAVAQTQEKAPEKKPAENNEALMRKNVQPEFNENRAFKSTAIDGPAQLQNAEIMSPNALKAVEPNNGAATIKEEEKVK